MRRDDFKTVLVIGSGPIIIGQACEFDYSGTQAIKTLKELGYRVILVNSNPATIMTDVDFADRAYIEPITKDSILRIIKAEGVEVILPSMGGQVALNAAMEVYNSGEANEVKFIGVSPEAIKKGEDRIAFKEAMLRIGMDMPRSSYAYDMNEALRAVEEIGFPLIIRASYTLGGAGSGVAYNIDEFKAIASSGLEISPINEILIEESLLGWEEYEMEVVRDKVGKCVLVCSIENIDPMGVHTGDSITIAPQQTLDDEAFERMKQASFDIVKEVGIDSGGSNIQFAYNRLNRRMIVIEMNPRVSRSSALASKATGYPIAKISTLLAAGFTLDEIGANFEPEVKYVVTKIPKFAFEKFPGASTKLGTAMKSVGEVMSIGANFKESFQKALCSLEEGLSGFDKVCYERKDELIYHLRNADDKRILYVAQALRDDMSVEEVHEYTKINTLFLENFKVITDFEKTIDMDILNDEKRLRYAKEIGFSDIMIAKIINAKDALNLTQNDIYYIRNRYNITQNYTKVPTKTDANYLYSSFSVSNIQPVKADKKVLIIGGGPNRIGQGIEFDYCCVHASYALKELGVTTIMYNCNPETVSTDYDTSDILYFEPIDFERLRAVIDREKPDGIIVHFGGQTPLKFAKSLSVIGANIIGTSPRVIDLAEDRKKFSQFIRDLGIAQPKNNTAISKEEAVKKAADIGYPVLVRPSYVLGGRAMRKVTNEAELREYMDEAVSVSYNSPVLLDKFLQNAVEVDVDAISDGKDVFVSAILEHVEEAGIHSGDSVSMMPPFSLSQEIVEKIYSYTKDIAINLGVVGLLNIQFAVYKGEIYMIEVNPRASRTVPFVSKVTGIPMAKVATRVMWQGDLKEALSYYDRYDVVGYKFGIYLPKLKGQVAVKESVFPFNKLTGADLILGPEMKSTGEVMGISDSYAKSFAKSQISANNAIPTSGVVFVSLADIDKERGVEVAKNFENLGFEILATGGTYEFLKNNGVNSQKVYKISEGRPNIEDKLKNRDIALVINTSDNKSSTSDASTIRQLVLRFKLPYYTTIKAALVASKSVEVAKEALEVKPLQDYLS
ncbi:MAG: carbamoyl-phosphate synthase large subunit [Campylobacter sp.]|nr:carbamoyl-phosphate synthase large subunit [Campylobacter sp.]